jgi:Dolichyl-phosphate-mannose-protein mannosyltransferase
MSSNLTARDAPDAKLTGKVATNLFLLLVSIYVLTSSGNTVDVTEDSIVRQAVTEDLVAHGSFAMREEMGRHWGLRGVDGRYYTNHGLGQSLLAVPFFVAGSLVGNAKFAVSLLGTLVSAGSCVVLFLLALRLGFQIALAASVALMAGLCTQIWAESKSPFDHHIETLFVLVCVWQLVSFRHDERRWRLLLAGAALGFAALTRVTTVLWLPPLFLFGYLSGKPGPVSERLKGLLREGVLFTAGLAPWIAFLFWYNHFRFGSIWEAGYSLWAAQRDLENFSNPVLRGLVGELVSPGKGALVYCPVLLLAIVGCRPFLRSRKSLGYCLILASVGYLMFFAKYRAWHGDNAWGPRYLTFLIPYWMLFAGAAWESWARLKAVSWRLTAKAVVGASLLLQVAGVMVDMNLHYLRLLRDGVIQNVETYAYPSKLYFDPQYSPLLNRFKEIGQAFRVVSVSSPPNTMLKPWVPEGRPEIDFWWLQPSDREAAAGFWLLACPFMLEVTMSACRIRKLLNQTVIRDSTEYDAR